VSRCLGHRVADLADGRLSPAESERAYSHLARCPSCRSALAAQRAASTRLGASASLEPSSDLLASLRGIAGPDAPAGPQQPTAGTHPSGAAGVRPDTRTSRHRLARRARRRVAVASAAGAAALVVAAVVGGAPAAVSGPSAPRPAIAPVVDTLTDEHAVTADLLPFSGPRVVTVGFAGTTSSQP
jgi:anti-sigma factor RsiW